MLTNFFGNRGFYDQWDDYNTAPYAQVRESDKAVLLQLEVPRYRAEDIQVTSDVDQGILTVTGRQPPAQYESEFENLVYATSSLGSFRRSFSFSPRHYDIANFSTKIENGVLSIIVPKQPKAPEPQAVTVFGGDEKGQLVTATTPELFKQIRGTKWPPTIRHEETAQALTYKCEMPPSITKDHVSIALRGQSLTLSIGYEYSLKTKNGEESQSLSYSTALAVPAGTVASDVSTSLDNGTLTITLAKHQSVPVVEQKK
jgi:HSP20 family molecular chaperone IbpA